MNEDQKLYLAGFQSSLAKMNIGEASDSSANTWDKRLSIYKDALKNAVLNEAKIRLKARPLFIKGRLLLKESPVISIVSGQWRIRTEVHIILEEIKYQDIY